MKYITSESFKWVGMGENRLSDLQVWRHTCLSIDFVNGLVKLIENGEIQYKTQNEGIKELGSTMNHVAAGCFYRPSGLTKYQSMYGRIADVQIFSTILSDQDMQKDI